MRTQTIEAENMQEAQAQMPWAARIVEVDDGNGGTAYKGFESIVDAEIWAAQS